MGHHTGLDHRDRMGGDQRTREEVGGPLSRASARTLENLTYRNKGVAVSIDETGRGSAMDNQRLKVTKAHMQEGSYICRRYLLIC